MSDEKVVQPVAPSTGEAAQATPPPVPQVFDEAKVKELLKSEVEAVSRRFQSDKDKSIAEVRRESGRAIAAARREAEAVYGQLSAVDPQAAELARLRSRDVGYREQETEESRRKQQDDFDNLFVGSMAESLQAMEIDPKDTRIDWAEDAKNKGDYVERQKRILKSAAVINQENRKTFLETEKRKMADEITAKVKKDLGVDSVDTSAPSGSANTDDKEFLRRFGSGELPLNKENKARYDKIQNSY